LDDALDKKIESAWIGHCGFAHWLTKTMKPETVVDLGTYHGASALALAGAGYGTIYTIDKFDEEEDYKEAKDNISTLDNIELIVSKFDDVVESWDKKIDILHIDGSHDYDSVKNDMEKWIPFVSDNGVILLHDTYNPSFGGAFFAYIEYPGEWARMMFLRSSGLGILTKNGEIANKIVNAYHPELVYASHLPYMIHFLDQLYTAFKKMAGEEVWRKLLGLSPQEQEAKD